MTTRYKSQQGFGHLGILLLLLVVAVVALAGYKVANSRQEEVASSGAQSASAQVVQPIKNSADLDKVESTLNNVNIDGDLNPDSLNQDVQSLL